jgi:hypothetical protein
VRKRYREDTGKENREKRVSGRQEEQNKWWRLPHSLEEKGTE